VAAIRAYRPDDADAIAALTLAAIRTTALRAYSPEQVDAWAARYSIQRVLDSAARGDVILVVADASDRPAAYAVLESGGHLDMLFCHPDHTGTGLGLALLEAAEVAARAQGVTRLFTEATELARQVFARAGYVLLHRRDFAIPFGNGAVAIHNYAMEKMLA